MAETQPKVNAVEDSFRGGQGGGRRAKPESTEGRPWGQSLKKPEGAPLNLG